MVVTMAAAGVAALLLLWLWTISAIGWRRTTSLRRGKTPHPPTRLRTVGQSSSAVTYLPGAAGLFLMATGVLGMAQGLGAWTAALVLVSAFVAAAGFAGRVTRLRLDPNGLIVHYAWRPSFELRWHDVAAVVPPRWPLGGWTMTSQVGRRVLMPSDLWGQEAILEVVIARAGLRFAERAWRGHGSDDGATRPSAFPSSSDGRRSGRSTNRAEAPRTSTPAWPDR